MKHLPLWIFFKLFLLANLPAFASHIVGGELYYDYLGNNQYRIYLNLYRNCSCTGCAPYGNPEYITIFNSSGDTVAQPAMPLPPVDTLAAGYEQPCFVLNPDICTELATYQVVITLPPLTGGYDIVYQRCCRSTAVINLVANEGATFTAHIPGPEVADSNSSPRFTGVSLTYFCVNYPFSVSYSAYDPDGDSLVYSLCSPLDGADQNSDCPDPSPNAAPGCPTAPPPPPYTPNQFVNPYSVSDFTNVPSDSNNLSIDPVTGLLTGIPDQVGVFDVTVCVQEFRHGTLLSTVSYDFQYPITQCNIDGPIQVINHGYPCPHYDTLSVPSAGAALVTWINADSTIRDTGFTFIPTVTGVYTATVILTSGCVLSSYPVSVDTSCFGSVARLDGEGGNFTMYPNPSSVFVTFQNTGSIPLSVKVSDISGKELSQFMLNQGQFQMPLSGLSAGVYFVSFTCADETFTTKLVKQ